MICKFCTHKMQLDDVTVGYGSAVDYDRDYVCKFCGSKVTQIIRENIAIALLWRKNSSVSLKGGK